jgi:hypothetical protein
MGLHLTLALTAACAAVAALCGWRGARAPDLRRGPRLIPWRALMMLAAAFALLFLVHLVNLVGLTTGRPSLP